MDRKYIDQLQHLAAVSLQYFLNCDIASFKNAFIIVAVLIYSFRHVIRGIGNAFYESALTVKEDAIEIKSMLEACKERWENSAAHEALITNINILIDKDFNHWRLK